MSKRSDIFSEICKSKQAHEEMLSISSQQRPVVAVSVAVRIDSRKSDKNGKDWHFHTLLILM